MNRSGTATVTLTSDTSFRITRQFDAPAAQVFAAWTEPEHIRRWWCPPGSTMTVCETDLRVGGRWRYVVATPDGAELAWSGTCLEVDPPTRMVSTEVFEDFPDAEAVDTLTLDEVDGVTTVTIDVVHKTQANRDAHLASGMEEGIQLAFERIDAVVAHMPG